MFLFEDCIIPTDNRRVVEILNKISDIWEDNACTKTTAGLKKPSPRIHRPYVSTEQKEALIELSTISPHILEEKLAEEASLYEILLLVAEE